jgi:hypothetical protein
MGAMSAAGVRHPADGIREVARVARSAIRARLVRFGEMEIDGRLFAYDVVLDRGAIRRRKKGPSRPARGAYGHTPLTAAEEIPWGPRGSRLIVGTGADGLLPLADDLRAEAARRGVEIVAVPTDDACELLEAAPPGHARAILHVTC